MTISKNSIAVVFDDHKMFADSFSSVIDRLQMFKSVQVVTDEKDLIQYFVKNAAQQEVYFFVDYHLRDRHSLPIINDVKKLHKQTHVIILSSVTDPILIQNILSYKPQGFLSKSNGFTETMDCIKTIAANESYVSPFITNILNQATKVIPAVFTLREIELLQYFDSGLSIAETAERVSLSKHTIVAHRRNMMEKAKCNSITELLAFARGKRII